MKYRCFAEGTPNYARYGGRGITVCEAWLDFDTFYEWAIENGYKRILSIDRIDGNGNYEPENCRWVTIQENLKNRNLAKKLVGHQIAEIRKRCLEDGVNFTALAREYGVSYQTIYRIKS